MAGVWLNTRQKRVAAFSLCSMRSQLRQMQDWLGAAVFFFFFFFLLSVLRLQALALPALWGWAKGHVVGVLILCSLGVGTKRPQTQQCTPPVLLASEERDAARACQREWDWWQDVTSSWSHSRGTRGAVNDTGRGDCAGLKILLEGALIYCAFHWKLDCKSFKDNKGVTFFFKNEN